VTTRHSRDEEKSIGMSVHSHRVAAFDITVITDCGFGISLSDRYTITLYQTGDRLHGNCLLVSTIAIEGFGTVYEDTNYQRLSFDDITVKTDRPAGPGLTDDGQYHDLSARFLSIMHDDGPLLEQLHLEPEPKLPSIFALVGPLLQTLGHRANDRSNGLFDSLRRKRAATLEENRHEMGNRDRFSGLNRLGGSRLGSKLAKR
jgi:hypothetical protein